MQCSRSHWRFTNHSYVVTCLFSAHWAWATCVLTRAQKKVKQITDSFRTKLATVVLLVSDFLGATGSDNGGDSTRLNAERRALIKPLAAAVKKFGVTFSPKVGAGAGDEEECAAAVALLLFGTPEVELPGGYSHSELSSESPIKMVRRRKFFSSSST